MKIPEIMNRDELSRTLWGFRYELMVVGIFSMVANLLMLTPTIYMLQVFDRVMLSQNTSTLMAVSLITLFFFGVLTFAEWSRSKLLVSTGVRLDALLSKRLFYASYEAYLNPEVNNPSRSFNDLTEVRQFLTGNGIFAFFDAPWAPIYIGVLFMLHPWLGVMALGFAAVQAVLALWGSQATKPAQFSASQSQQEVSGFLQSKFRNAEVIESMGMLRHLYRRWSERNSLAIGSALNEQVCALHAAVIGFRRWRIVGHSGRVVSRRHDCSQRAHDKGLGAHRFDGGYLDRILERQGGLRSIEGLARSASLAR
jgi:ATP-binding cassette subfamily C exporter for protease/lipase